MNNEQMLPIKTNLKDITHDTANLRTKVLDLRGFDASIVSLLRGGIARPMGNLPEEWYYTPANVEVAGEEWYIYSCYSFWEEWYYTPGRVPANHRTVSTTFWVNES